MYSSKCEHSIKTSSEHDNVDETEGEERGFTSSQGSLAKKIQA
jgi:hypothetical protein